MNKGENLTVILVAHNRLEYTKRTIESLIKTVPNAHFIFVDNDSTDGTKEYIRDLVSIPELAGISYAIEIPENVGWGKAVNLALEGASEGIAFDISTEYVLISNNDVGYSEGWLDTCIGLNEKYPQIGILGVWKHVAHGILEDKGDLIVKDQMPAVGWLMKKENLEKIGAFPEHGPCATKGGNGEDTFYCDTARSKGFLVCGPKNDVADHFDGY